jgi:hypothetical protein
VLLSWQQAIWLVIALMAMAAVGRWGGRRPAWCEWAREAALLLALFAFWQWLLGVGVNSTVGAAGHGMAIWHLERDLHFPSERTVQHAVLHAPTVMRALNFYYAGVHVQDVLLCLVWMFWRHRDAYRPARNALALMTLATAFLQFIPVAPPRLLAATGVVDAGRLLGYAIYPLNGLHDASQLTAMPSVHVAWAAWVGIVVVRSTKSKWRWLVLADPILTVASVIATGYHFWLDAVVAVVLVWGAIAISGRQRRPRGAHQVEEVGGVEPLLGVEGRVGE